MKNFFLADSSEQMGVRRISVSWAQKRLIPTLQTSCTSNSWENFSGRFERTDGCWTDFGLLSPKTFLSYILDMMYVGFMKNFFSPIRATYYLFYPFPFLEPKNSSFLLSRHHVRRIIKNIFPPILASWGVLDSLRPLEYKNVSFLLYRHHVRRIHEKGFSRRFERTDGC